MNSGTIARIGAAGFVVTAIVIAAIQATQPDRPKTETISISLDEGDADPLRAELRRCRSIGEAAASDQICLRAWAEQRSRFFMQTKRMREEWRDDAGNPFPADNASTPGPAASSANPTNPTLEGSH
jgi:conjugative transfer region protein TrbK